MKMWFVNNICLARSYISGDVHSKWEQTERGWERNYSNKRKNAKLDINAAYASLSIFYPSNKWIDIVEEIEM